MYWMSGEVYRIENEGESFITPLIKLATVVKLVVAGEVAEWLKAPVLKTGAREFLLSLRPVNKLTDSNRVKRIADWV